MTVGRAVEARGLAEQMHGEAVDLWNLYWEAAGRNDDFPGREQIEAVQRTLSALAWPVNDDDRDPELGPNGEEPEDERWTFRACPECGGAKLDEGLGDPHPSWPGCSC